MVTRSLVATLPSLRSAIAHQTFVVSTDAEVVEAIALLSGITVPQPSPSTSVTPNNATPNNNLPTPPPPQPSCLLVQEEGQIIGILTSQDVMRLVVQQLPLEQLVIGQVMSHPIISLRESALTNVADAIQLLEQHQIKHLPVLNDQGGLVGLLTYPNLCQALLAQASTTAAEPVEPQPQSSAELIASPVGIFKTDIAGHCVGVNRRWCEIAGLTSEQAMGNGWRQGLHPEDREKIAAEWYQSVQEKRPFQLEYRFQLPDGEVTWVYGQSVAEEDANGQVTGYVGTITDISDRKAAEIALNNVIAGTAAIMGRDFFPSLVHHIAKALDVAYVVVSERVNDQLQTLAYWANGSLQANFSFALAGTPCECVLQEGSFYTHDLLQEQFPSCFILASMEAKSYLGIALQNAQGEKIGNLCIFDRKVMLAPEKAQKLLTVFAARATAELERQRATASLEQLNRELEAKVEARVYESLERENFLNIVLDTFPFPVFWKDLNSVYLGCNCHYLNDIKLTSVQDIVGKSDYDLPWTTEAAAACQADDQAVIQSASASRDVRLTHLTPEQKPRWFETHKIPLRNIHGEIIGVVGMYQDISDRKTAELKLEQTNQELARATRLKDEFLANMSHELRTPLNAIQGMTEGLQEQVFGEVNEKQLNALQTIESSSQHLLELINDILDVAKIEAGQVKLNFSPTGLVSLCESSLAFIKRQAQKKSIQIKLKIQPELPMVMVDARRLRQALINLLSNAVKFTPAKGCISLAVDDLGPAEDAAATGSFTRIAFAVRDNGIGIAPEEISQLFQPFVQIDSALNRQYQGTGLGLALVKRIAELHGGDVSLESELGQGSCFTLKLPCAICESSPAQTPSIPSVQGQPFASLTCQDSPRILLVEDNEDNIQTFSTYLAAKGYQLRLAKNGQEAIAQVQTEQPDIILMDIQMPGMDGLEAIRQIRSNSRIADLPIIALTALAMTGDRDRCLAAGADEYLSKPVKLQQLLRAIQQLTSRSKQ